MYADEYGGCWHNVMVSDVIDSIEFLIKDRDFWKDAAIKLKEDKA